MMKLNVGAQRQAMDLARLSAANDLVQQTLAKHGLVPAADHGKPAAPPSGLGGMTEFLSRLESNFPGRATATVPIPEGAQFLQDTFSCTAGRRSYRTYVPASAKEGVSGLIVMLHGCTQSPEDFAIGTGMNGLAEEHRFVVVYPQQSRGNNAQSCWNWFSLGDQRRGRGEPAILAGVTKKVMAEHGVSRERTFVGGLSAGAAMAVILGETYPDVFSGVGAHSGLPYGAAKDVPSAYAAMAGNVQEPRRSGSTATGVRTIVFHGTSDNTVNLSNAERIAEQALDYGSSQTVTTQQKGKGSGRSFTRSVTSASDGTIELEQWVIDGLGHAWSGGRPEGSYTDAKGPDASAEMVRFFFNTPGKES